MGGSPPAFHPLQLTSVVAVSLSAVRRPVRDGDPPAPRFAHSSPRALKLAAGGESFQCRVRVYVDIPVLEGELFHGDVTLDAFFIRVPTEPITAAIARRFAREQVLYILWPFARAYLDHLAVLSSVGVPPLPLLLVPRPRGR